MITTPMFDNDVKNIGNGKQLKIVSKNLSPANIYIRSAKSNGKKLDRSQFTHTEIKEGELREFEMTASPSGWVIKTIDINSVNN